MATWRRSSAARNLHVSTARFGTFINLAMFMALSRQILPNNAHLPAEFGGQSSLLVGPDDHVTINCFCGKCFLVQEQHAVHRTSMYISIQGNRLSYK